MKDETESRRKAILDWWFSYSPRSRPQIAADVDIFAKSNVPIPMLLQGFRSTASRMESCGSRPLSIGVFWKDFLDVECAYYKLPPTYVDPRVENMITKLVSRLTDAS